MEFTSNHFIFIFGILLGVIFTLIGTGFIEYLKNQRLKKRLITALYHEARANTKQAGAFLKLVDNKAENKYVPFKTVAYEQYKLTIMIDEKSIPDFSELLVNAYILAELFNRKIEMYEKTPSLNQKLLLKKNMI